MKKVYEQIKKDLIENLDYTLLSDYIVLSAYVLEEIHNIKINNIYYEEIKMFKHIVIEIENSSILIDIVIKTTRNYDDEILIKHINRIDIKEI